MWLQRVDGSRQVITHRGDIWYNDSYGYACGCITTTTNLMNSESTGRIADPMRSANRCDLRTWYFWQTCPCMWDRPAPFSWVWLWRCLWSLQWSLKVQVQPFQPHSTTWLSLPTALYLQHRLCPFTCQQNHSGLLKELSQTWEVVSDVGLCCSCASPNARAEIGLVLQGWQPPTVSTWYGINGSRHGGQGQQNRPEDKGYTPATCRSILPPADSPSHIFLPSPSCAGTSAGAEWRVHRTLTWLNTERSRTPIHTVGPGSPFGKLSQGAAWPSLALQLPSLSSFPSTLTISGRDQIVYYMTYNNGTQLTKNSYGTTVHKKIY